MIPLQPLSHRQEGAGASDHRQRQNLPTGCLPQPLLQDVRPPSAAVCCQATITCEGLVNLLETLRLNMECFHAFVAHEKTASCSSDSAYQTPLKGTSMSNSSEGRKEKKKSELKS